MSWIPSIISERGMYGGRLIPNGSVTKFADLGYIQADNVVTNVYLRDDQTDDVIWEGAFGCSSDALFAALNALGDDGSVSDSLLFEITVKKPEGATYYKQTLAIFCDYSRVVRKPSTYEEELNTFTISAIYRREYATPYSEPVSTLLHNGISGCNFNYIRSVDPDTVKPAYYFEYNRVLLGCSTGYKDGDPYFGPYFYVEYTRTGDNMTQAFYGFAGIPIEVLDEEFGGDFEPEEQEDPNDEPEDPDNPPPGPGGGGGGGGTGEHDLPDEGVPVPGLPEVGAASVNWLTVYKMTQAQINEFGMELIDPSVWDIVKSWFTNPLDAIIGITLIPCDAPTTRTKYPEVGGGITGHTWANAYPVLTKEFVEINCGSILIKPYWDSAFDFDPYTKFSIFLPFCGFKAIKADDIMGATVSIKYHVNVMTGDCVAFISRSAQSESIYGPINSQVIGEYNGNCAIRVPIGRVSHDAAIDASMRLMATGLGMVGGAIAGAALGDPMETNASQISNQISSATMTTVNGMKQSVERSGALGGSTGYMGNLRPFIIREIPRQFLPDNYKQLNGYPANKGGTLGHYSGTGFQAVETIRLDNIGAFDSEISEILSLLKGGVLV